MKPLPYLISAFAILAWANCPAAIVDGLVEYWDMNGNANASVTAAHNGTINTTGTGSGTFVTSRAGFGQAIDLESSTGNQAHIIVGGNENDFDFAGGSMSFSLWYTTESLYTSWQTIISKGEGSAWRFGRASGNSSLTRLVPGNRSLNGLVLEQWYHAVGVFDYDGVNTTITLYINGSSSTEVAAGQALGGSTNSLRIGENPGATGRSWDGKIDDVAVWNRALTPAEVAQIYNSGTGATIGSLIPEPSSALLAALGSLMLLRRRR